MNISWIIHEFIHECIHELFMNKQMAPLPNCHVRPIDSAGQAGSIYKPVKPFTYWRRKHSSSCGFQLGYYHRSCPLHQPLSGTYLKNYTTLGYLSRVSQAYMDQMYASYGPELCLWIIHEYILMNYSWIYVYE